MRCAHTILSEPLRPHQRPIGVLSKTAASGSVVRSLAQPLSRSAAQPLSDATRLLKAGFLFSNLLALAAHDFDLGERAGQRRFAALTGEGDGYARFASCG